MMLRPGSDRRSPVALVVRSAALAVLVLGATGCMEGQRPSFEDSPTVEGTMTGDPAIDAVLTRLDAVSDSVFTAEFTATLLFGGAVSSSTVTRDATQTRQSVTIGNVRYISEASGRRTCALDTLICEPEIQAAAVSNTGLTPDFAFGDMAKRLRRDAVARIGTATPSNIELAGRTSTCVDVPVSGGTKQYCVFDNGVIARFVGADLSLDVLTTTDVVDEALFTP